MSAHLTKLAARYASSRDGDPDNQITLATADDMQQLLNIFRLTQLMHFDE